MAPNTAHIPHPTTQNPVDDLSIPSAPVAAPTSSSQTTNSILTATTTVPHPSHLTTQSPVTSLSNPYAAVITPVAPNLASSASTTTTTTAPPHQRVEQPVTVQYPNTPTQYAPTQVLSTGSSTTSNSHQPRLPHDQVPSQPEARPSQHISGQPSLVGPSITNTGHKASLPHRRGPSQTTVNCSQQVPGPNLLPGPPITNNIRQHSQAQLMQKQAHAQLTYLGSAQKHSILTPSPPIQPSAHNKVPNPQHPHHFKPNPTAPTFLINNHSDPNAPPPSHSPYPSSSQVPALGGPSLNIQPFSSNAAALAMIERYGKALKNQEIALQSEISDDENILAVIGDTRGLPEIEYSRFVVWRRIEAKRKHVGGICVTLKGDGVGA